MNRLASVLAVTALSIPACSDSVDPYEGETVKTDDGKADASSVAVFVDLSFSGRLLTNSSNNTKSIQDQLLYTVGQLNGFTAVGRVDKARLTNVVRSTVNGRQQITYDAVLPVAWGRRNAVPATVDLILPVDISFAGKTAFAEKYGEACVDASAHDVSAGSMFYHYRPLASGCSIDPADVITVSASVAPSPSQTTGKFPEYDKVWEDNVFEVLAIFGKYEDGATSGGDAGIAAYNEFAGLMRSELSSRNLTTIPETVPSSPGVAVPTIEWSASLPDGKLIHVTGMLTDNVNDGLQDPVFRAKYEALSTRADLIAYNGHAGLGSNIRALAQAGQWVAGQYVIVFMNGCDTFAYIDSALNDAHRAVNPDDTTGDKYIDIVNNSMPAFFVSMADSTMAIFRGLIGFEAPKTYEQIFRNIDSSQVVMVTGEQDNVFTPGGGGEPMPWGGLTDHGTVARNEVKSYSTPTVAAGRYQFAITGSNDSDLYVRIGNAPTTSTYDCRPYKTGSNETCEVELAQPAQIFVMVRGYSSASSTFDIVGKQL
jgi:hypothetical protein